MRHETGVAKLIILFFLLLHFQVVLILSLYTSKSGYFSYSINSESLVIGSAWVLLFITVFAICNVRNIFNKLQEDIEQKIRETSLENINEVLSALRAQRHDYINHLNSIYSLLGQGKVEKVKEYIIGISKEIKNLGPPVNCDNIWISALLQSKKGTAQSQKINLEYEIRGKLDELPLSPWEISKVLGNLIDNSIEAVENQPDFARNVLVYIGESRDNFIFRVSNSGEAIPESEIKKIFKKGYTTKARGEGLGLSIVKSIVESYDGYVNVRSKEEITSFELIIPK